MPKYNWRKHKNNGTNIARAARDMYVAADNTTMLRTHIDGSSITLQQNRNLEDIIRDQQAQIDENAQRIAQLLENPEVARLLGLSQNTPTT